jgi:16S rRNA G1207 methylase RsmC
MVLTLLNRLRAHDASITVRDVGGGYGVVPEDVLQPFPRSRVTLQDYSQPMLGREQAAVVIVAVRAKR